MAHKNLSRRDFVKTAAGVSGAALFAGGAATGAELSVPKTVLGRTGVEVSRLGIGCAYFQREHVTPEHTRAVLLRGLELGVNYLDTAPNYATGDHIAEVKMGPAIKEIRDKVFLVTKTEEPTYEGTWKLMRQSMERMQTDRLDLVHLHNFGETSRFGDLDLVFSERGAMGALREAKKLGVIRFIGATGHLHPSRFHAALDTGEIDVLMNAVNYVTQHTYNFEGKVWDRARKENIGLVAMKVLGGVGNGNGYKIPTDQYERAIRYAMGLPGCHCCVIGIETVEHLEQAARVIAANQPLSAGERAELDAAGSQLAKTDAWATVYGGPLT